MHDFSLLWNSLSVWGKVFFSCVMVGGVGFVGCWFVLVCGSIFNYRLLKVFRNLTDEVRLHHPQFLESLQTQTSFAVTVRKLVLTMMTTMDKISGQKPTRPKLLISQKAWHNFICSDVGDEHPVIAGHKRAIRPYWLLQYAVTRMAFCCWLLALFGMLGMIYRIAQFKHP